MKDSLSEIRFWKFHPTMEKSQFTKVAYLYKETHFDQRLYTVIVLKIQVGL
jgi:hypothetical protein